MTLVCFSFVSYCPRVTEIFIISAWRFDKIESLKEQYPVTAHVPNFDFISGRREFKRCEEGKRTLKNPFASRLAEFDTTLKLFRITDQWYIVPVKF